MCCCTCSLGQAAAAGQRGQGRPVHRRPAKHAGALTFMPTILCVTLHAVLVRPLAQIGKSGTSSDHCGCSSLRQCSSSVVQGASSFDGTQACHLEGSARAWAAQLTPQCVFPCCRVQKVIRQATTQNRAAPAAAGGTTQARAASRNTGGWRVSLVLTAHVS